jgi:hypothetical protein
VPSSRYDMNLPPEQSLPDLYDRTLALPGAQITLPPGMDHALVSSRQPLEFAHTLLGPGTLVGVFGLVHTSFDTPRPMVAEAIGTLTDFWRRWDDHPQVVDSQFRFGQQTGQVTQWTFTNYRGSCMVGVAIAAPVHPKRCAIVQFVVHRTVFASHRELVRSTIASLSPAPWLSRSDQVIV